MPGKIYLLQDNGDLQSLTEHAYENEDMLQGLIGRYPDLLAGDQIDETTPRRWLLAKAATRFMDSLLVGAPARPEETISIFDHLLPVIPGRVEGDEEEQLIADRIGWMVQQKLPSGEYQYELADEETGSPLAILDLARPDGVQAEYSQPVALLIDEDDEVKDAATQAGYRYFTGVEGFQDYVKQEILAMETINT